MYVYLYMLVNVEKRIAKKKKSDIIALEEGTNEAYPFYFICV
jgi:hypothetical protein